MQVQQFTAILFLLAYQFETVWSQLDSLACAPGKFRDVITVSCQPCPQNSWNDQWNQTSCTPCLANQQLLQTGGTSSVQCTACPTNQLSEQGSSCVCPSPDYTIKLGNCVSWASQSKPATCDYINQYRGSTGDCITAQKKCTSGQTINCCPVGINVIHTKTTDSICYLGIITCGSGYFMAKSLVLDDNDVVTSEVQCKLISTCTNKQYEFRPPSSTQDRVCIRKTDCSQGPFYEAHPATNTSDAVCLPRAQCDYSFQFLLVYGGLRANDICGTMAAPCPYGYFLSSPARNATSSIANGTAGTCTAYTQCNPGSYPRIAGTETSDRVCSLCQPGTYSSDGKACVTCSDGYSTNWGSTECLACSVCLGQNVTGVIPSGYTQCPSNQTCRQAYLSLCTATNNSVCTLCPDSSWSFDSGTGLCRPCATGYHHLPGVSSLAACVKCPSNVYCDSPSTFSACQNIQAFKKTATASSLTIVPQASAGSSRPQDCSCALAGGFDDDTRGGGLVGCVPCAAGYYSVAGSAPGSKCQPCPRGSWSRQTTGVWDYYKCPQAGQPLQATVTGPDGVAIQSSSQGVAPCTMTVGASQCNVCPFNHTIAFPATGPGDCSICNLEEWFDSLRRQCVQCSPKCATPDSYEVSPCTQTSDRICSSCDRTCSGLGEYSLSQCPGKDPTNPSRGCGPCFPPPENAAYIPKPESMVILSPSQCLWNCNAGYYNKDFGSSFACERCTVFNSTSCPAGLVHSPCTATSDASCSLPCSDPAMPSSFASYVLTRKTPEGEFVEAMDNEEGPNEGCLWNCNEGYKLFTTEGGLSTCRKIQVV